MRADPELAPPVSSQSNCFSFVQKEITVFLSYRHLLRHVHGLGRLLLRVHEGKLVGLLEDLEVVVINSASTFFFCVSFTTNFPCGIKTGSLLRQRDIQGPGGRWNRALVLRQGTQASWQHRSVFVTSRTVLLTIFVHPQQEGLEASAREELLREEIEQRVGGLRELEEAGREEQLTP
jgi:hypothetical protein